jgi:hypothetical protein
MLMLKTAFAAALVSGVVTLSPLSFAASDFRVAQATTTPATTPPASTPTPSAPQPKTKAKSLTPQQQKMKVCAGQWTEEKTKTGEKGRTAYRKFMSQCLKKPAA